MAVMPDKEDMAEAFASRLNRFQDMLGDKLLPAVLLWKGEKVAAFIDNLNRAERLNWVESTSEWLEMRALRNRLVHEYILDAEEFAQSLNLANELSDTLFTTWQNIQDTVRVGDASN